MYSRALADTLVIRNISLALRRIYQDSCDTVIRQIPSVSILTDPNTLVRIAFFRLRLLCSVALILSIFLISRTPVVNRWRSRRGGGGGGGWRRCRRRRWCWTSQATYIHAVAYVSSERIRLVREIARCADVLEDYVDGAEDRDEEERCQDRRAAPATPPGREIHAAIMRPYRRICNGKMGVFVEKDKKF